MEIQVITQTVKIRKYVTDDGMEFDDKLEAEAHEIDMKFEQEFKISLKDIERDVNYYFVIKNKEHLTLFHNYITNEYACDIRFDKDNTSYPIAVVYDQNGSLDVIPKEEYDRFKSICIAYEKANQMEG